MRAHLTVRILAPLLILAGCEASRPAARLAIGGDTLIHVAIFELPDGSKSADCGYRLSAHLDGSAADTAVITSGRVTYTFVDDGSTHGTWEWTPERLSSIWSDPRLAGGQTTTSLAHDIAFSLPYRPVRGEVVFDYTMAGSETVRSTAPFTFTCR